MKSNWRSALAGSMCLAAVVLVAASAGCAVDVGVPGSVELVDAHGYHHRGYYDNHHDWHGGYDDENHVHHDDPHDWHN